MTLVVFSWSVWKDWHPSSLGPQAFFLSPHRCVHLQLGLQMNPKWKGLLDSGGLAFSSLAATSREVPHTQTLLPFDLWWISLRLHNSCIFHQSLLEFSGLTIGHWVSLSLDHTIGLMRTWGPVDLHMDRTHFYTYYNHMHMQKC